jgi:hypothetical protein
MATRDETADDFLRKEGPLGNSQHDEPVFVLVARDKAASGTVRHWAKRATDLGAPEEKVAEALELANQMDAWRAANGGGKVPD